MVLGIDPQGLMNAREVLYHWAIPMLQNIVLVNTFHKWWHTLR